MKKRYIQPAIEISELTPVMLLAGSGPRGGDSRPPIVDGRQSEVMERMEGTARYSPWEEKEMREVKLWEY